jgi:hypothetical protein
VCTSLYPLASFIIDTAQLLRPPHLLVAVPQASIPWPLPLQQHHGEFPETACSFAGIEWSYAGQSNLPVPIELNIQPKSLQQRMLTFIHIQSALCAAFASDSSLGHWRKGCRHVPSELQQCCLAAAAVCLQSKLSPSLLAAPESRFSAVASAAIGLQLEIIGLDATQPTDAVASADDASAFSAPVGVDSAPSFSSYVLLDCGIDFIQADTHRVTSNMPLALVSVITKANQHTIIVYIKSLIFDFRE